MQPLDRCPYSRFFTPAFVDDPDCPAYQGTTFTVMDTADHPLRAAQTCRHLAIGNEAGRPGRFYPRCGLGGSDDRVRWVAAVTPARLAVMRALEEEFAQATLAGRTELLAAKAALLRGEPAGADVEDLEVRVSAFLDRVDAFIEERADRLADVGLAAGEMQELLAGWSIAWLRSRDLYGPGTELVESSGIGATTAALLGADLGGGVPTPAAEDTVTTQEGALAIMRSDSTLAIRLRGEVDVTNADALGTALARALAGGRSVTVDFREVLFCDLSGLRALVQAAQACAAGQEIHVVALPEHLHRAMRLVGWSGLPGLVIAPPAPAGWRWRWRA